MDRNNDIDINRLATLISAKIVDKVSEKVVAELRRQMATDSIADDKLISAKEAARKLGVSFRTFSATRIGDRLPYVTLPGGTRRYLESKVIPAIAGLV